MNRTLGALALAFAWATPAVANAGCEKDSDCKGDRICVKGECAAPAPATQSPALPPSPVVPGPAPGSFAPSAMAFGTPHLTALRDAGAPLDDVDAALADRFSRRGFGPDDYVAAYQATRLLKASYPRAASFPRDVVEVVAIGQRLKLDSKQIYRLASGRFEGNLSLTEAYNSRVVRGRGRTVAGAVLVGAAAAFAGGGVAFKISASDKHSKGLSDDSDSIASWAMFGLGAASLIAGLPTLIVGLTRDGGPPRLDDGVLDGAGPLRVDSGRGTGASVGVTLAPILDSRSAGGAVTIAF